MFEFYVQKL